MPVNLDSFMEKLTDEQTKEVFVLALGFLNDQDVVTLLDENLSDSLKQELVAEWFEEEEIPEE